MSINYDITTVPQTLRDIMQPLPRVAVAFSGGVDSSYLLYAAKSCGCDVHAYYVSSQFQPQFELDDAVRLANDIGAGLTVLTLDVLANDRVRANPADRCYYCKQVIFGTILSKAAADGYTVIIDGSNASDDAGDRPGMRALAELAVLSPLRQAGLTKDNVRSYSRMAELFTWNKPSYACLATRLPTGTAITAEALERIEKAEDTLAEMGFADLRVRVNGGTAKLQLPAEQIPKAAERHNEIVQALSPWFDDVLLDLRPR